MPGILCLFTGDAVWRVGAFLKAAIEQARGISRPGYFAKDQKWDKIKEDHRRDHNKCSFFHSSFSYVQHMDMAIEALVHSVQNEYTACKDTITL
jgi:hypothetical protein